MGGATALVVTYPLDLLRTRMAVDTRGTTNKLGGRIFAAGRDVVRREGIVGLYKGLIISILEISPYVPISLRGYNFLKDNYSEHIATLTGPCVILSKLAVGWASGLMGSLTCYPLDTVKRVLMVDGSEAAGMSARAPHAAHTWSLGTLSTGVAHNELKWEHRA